MFADIVVSLLTLEGQAYGPDSLVGIRVIETLRAPPPSQHPSLQTPAARAGALLPSSASVGGPPKMGPPSAPRRPLVALAPKPVATQDAGGGGGGGGAAGGGGGGVAGRGQAVISAPMKAGVLLAPSKSDAQTLCNRHECFLEMFGTAGMSVIYFKSCTT